MESVEAASNSHRELAESIKSELLIQSYVTVDAVGPRLVRGPEPPIMLSVPDHIRKLNPEAYKPCFISIGPLHHGQPELQEMEAFKKRYALSFIQKYDVDVEALIDFIKDCEGRLRNDYGVITSEISSDDFVKIMLIDGAFLMEFFLRKHYSRYEEIDRMSRKKWHGIMSDLLLLENQIPSYYVKKLLYIYEASPVVKKLGPYNMSPFYAIRFNAIGCETDGASHRFYVKGDHLLDDLRVCMNYKGAVPELVILSNPSCLTISQLHRAGVRIRPCRSGSEGARITFQRGILELPQLIIDQYTKNFFMNLLALECQDLICYATDYIVLMDCLIDGPEDVQILVEKGILQNLLESDEAAANLINEIGRSIDVRPRFLYSRLVEDLNSHCQRVWIKWKSTYLFEWKKDLKKNYFSTPWKTLSVIAAIILLGLTVAQTVFSYLQLKV